MTTTNEEDEADNNANEGSNDYVYNVDDSDEDDSNDSTTNVSGHFLFNILSMESFTFINERWGSMLIFKLWKILTEIIKELFI